MKAIQYTKQIVKQIIHLVYATCTNDLIIYSKQASNVELFVLAFFIECNRLFIADSRVMHVVRNEILLRAQNVYQAKAIAVQNHWFSLKNMNFEFLHSDKSFPVIYQEEHFRE